MKYILFIFFLLVQIGCTKTVYVPVESVKTDIKEVFKRDSIHVHDSVFVKLSGDTVTLEKYKTIYRDRYIKDSVFLCDTIRVPYPVEKVVYRNKTSWYQDLLIYAGMIFLLFIFGKLFFKRF